MTTVYIVECGEKGEGGRILGVFKNTTSAVKLALAKKPNFGPWEPLDQKFTLPDQRCWRSGCDWITVTPYEVQS